ncbi:hypothetical protein HOE22_07010 [Candidatus Woesearchaeota archaeon]|nr:hypothetical protein [Candidatus Woesearchaeota archaeon]
MRENMNKDLKYFNPMKLREKYSVKPVGSNYSSFWLNNDWDTTSSWDEDDKPKGPDLIQLASYRRAIANFVNIVTSKNIPVTFNATGDSFTDGKKVTISAKLDDGLFDSAVGLALHEGSHILLSDFDFLKDLENSIPTEYFNRGYKKGYSRTDIKVHIKNLLNYVEDRRIDYYVFSNSPGYKGYYHSMYDKYFHSKIVDKALGTDEYTEENLDSYMFRIINLTNSNTRLDKLNGLREVWKVLDLKNISRLSSTESAFETALNIYNVVLNNVPDGTKKTDENGDVSYERADGSGDSAHSDSDMDGSGSSSNEPREISDNEFEELLDSIENGVDGGNGNGGESIDLDLDSDGDSSSSSTDGGSGSSSNEETENVPVSEQSKVLLSDSQKKTLENAIKKQKKFMDDDVQKKKLSKKDKSAIDAIDASGMSYKEVGKDLKDRWDGSISKKTKCVLVKNYNQTLVDSGTIDMVSKHNYYGDDTELAVKEGLRLGTVLGRKLSVRTETRDTKYTRKDAGRIDKRLIAELGFGNSNVFSQTFVDSFPDAFLHISVDASGSMGGSKWTRTMTSVVAMTKAIDMIEGVDVVVSFRSTQHATSGRGRQDNPIMLIAYDSRKDSLIKVKTLFKYLRPNGTTPEGLCYEAIMDEMVEGMENRESYFLNFSDGMPMFGNEDVAYHHNTALNHTKKMVKEIRNRGIKVVSYYIGDSYDTNRNMGEFKTMYGKDSEFVDVTSVTAVSRTMNKKFLEKN